MLGYAGYAGILNFIGHNFDENNSRFIVAIILGIILGIIACL